MAEVSVVIPTIGRPALLLAALESLSACEPRAAEILVVDQSTNQVSEPVLGQVDLPEARVIRSSGQGIGRAANDGIEAASHDAVLMIHDDCTVSPDWVGVGFGELQRDPEGMISGRVLPAGGDSRLVPSTNTVETPRDYTGDVYRASLYPNNMGCPRNGFLSMGGFDERIIPAGEDGEFCYRWVRAGRRFRHVPELVVWHHAWRTPEELERMYVGYYRGLGMFYAKHLAKRDPAILRLLATDLYQGLRSLYAARFRGVERWADERRGVFQGLPKGLRAGWREFRARPGP